MLTNAIKFCENSRDSYLHIKAVIEPGWLLLIFEDNGIGIDLQKHKEKIFGMYKIIHPRADSKGLGLFMTLNQVEAMGGKIDVFSEENIGTTFIIKLPYEQN
jgi:signal transduction histidine kinase